MLDALPSVDATADPIGTLHSLVPSRDHRSISHVTNTDGVMSPAHTEDVSIFVYAHDR